MARKKPPARPWFRIPFRTRRTAPDPIPTPTPTPTPITLAQDQPPALQPRPPFIGPATVRPPVTQPQVPVAAAPPPAATASPPTQPPSPVSVRPSSFLPTSPALKPSPKSTVVSSSSMPPSPPKSPKGMSPRLPPALISATTVVNSRGSTPKIINPPWPDSPPLSPKTNLLSSLPPPLLLPHAQIEFEGEPETKIPLIPAESKQKTIVLMQETFEEPKVIPPNTSNGNFQNHVSVIDHNGKPEVKTDMETKDHKGSPTNLISDGEKLESNRNIEAGRSKLNDKTHKMASPLKSTIFLNSNVQDVNNSILYNFSFTHHDPGAHLSLSRKSNGGGRPAMKLSSRTKINGEREGYQ